MRILVIGDVVGKPGRRIVERTLKGLKKRQSLDLVIANAENVADGSGITPKDYERLCQAGVDCLTLGDHIYRRREIIPVLERETNIVKPANFPLSAPGREWASVTAANGTPVAVISLLGRVFMRPVDCPFAAVDRVLKQIPQQTLVRIVDFHAEATSDMQLMGRYLDGRVSAVLGTHTHVATADEQVLPGGTAFQCDLGMTGPYASVLGRKIDRVMETTLTFRPTQFQVATKDPRLCGSIVDIDPVSGLASGLERVQIREHEVAELESWGDDEH